jgi:hypothetical protein
MAKMNGELSIDEFMNAAFSEEGEFLKFIEAASETLKIYQIPEDEKKMRQLEAKSFLGAAEEDFKSAKILYESEIYSAAIYHLQQAVEKFVKAYMLMVFGLTKKEIRDYVGHDSPKAFLKLLDKFKKVLNPALLLTGKAHSFNDQVPKISDQDIHKIENLIKTNRGHIAKMSSKEIEHLITLAYELNEILDNPKNQEMIKDSIISAFEALIKNPNKIGASVKDRKEIIKMIENTDITFKDHSKIPVLYLLSIITYPHVTFARYPNKILSPDKYDKTLGIVQCFDKIADLLDKMVTSWKVSLEQDKIVDRDIDVEGVV